MPDVVFLGDSIVENWSGTNLGISRAELHGIAKTFDRYFHKDQGGLVNGLPLGIAGDRISQLLYRVEHGGFGKLDPHVFWLMIGTNDAIKDNCSEESIVAGIIAVAESIAKQRPNATVVINLLLPRSRWVGSVVQSINQRIKCYAQATKRNVIYFNATSLFYDPTTSTKLKHLPDMEHPDEEGTKAWTSAMAQKVAKLIRHRTVAQTTKAKNGPN